MKTYYLGGEEVQGYLNDLIARLRQFDPLPRVWLPVTQSGDDLLRALLKAVQTAYPELLEWVRVLPIEVNAEGVHFVDDDHAEALRGQSALVFDGTVHSGRMMSRCVTAVLRHEPAALCTYSLVMKRGSVFIPTLWGLMIEESDRAYFLLGSIPNNRLDAGKRPQPLVHLRKLDTEMLERPMIKSGVDSMDRMTWSDRHYQMQTSGGTICTYLLERGSATVGFLTLRFDDGEHLWIDEVVVDEARRKAGYGGVLLRFADSMARHADCQTVRLNAIWGEISTYTQSGYRPIPGRAALRLGEEEYQPMEKFVLHHQGPIS